MRKIGVVGSGTMGSEIAFVIASSIDARVIVRDVTEEALVRGRAIVEKVANRAVQRGHGTEDEKKIWLQRLDYTINMSDLADAEIVIEAVFEDIDTKKKVFAELDRVCASAQFLASNTSGLSLTQLGAATGNPKRVIGTHFFNPASLMRLVEIVRGFETSDETLQKAREFCASIGKETVVAKDFPGFVTTRIGQAMIGEAIRCLEQGVATVEDIDKAMKLSHNHPVGPLELVDLIGLDVELDITESLLAEYGETFRPSPLLKQMVAAGKLGRKTGQGFYTYTKR